MIIVILLCLHAVSNFKSVKLHQAEIVGFFVAKFLFVYSL